MEVQSIGGVYGVHGYERIGHCRDHELVFSFFGEHPYGIATSFSRAVFPSFSGANDSWILAFDLSLSVIADLIAADFGSRVYYAVQSGFDTHSRQLNDHSELLGSLSSSASGFLQDVKASGNADRVLVMCFSESGRPD